MRTKLPPNARFGGSIGLCVALAALGACAAPDAGSPVAGSAAPVTTLTPDAVASAGPAPAVLPASDRAPTGPGEVDGRLATPETGPVDARRSSVEQQPVVASERATLPERSSADEEDTAATPSGGATDTTTTTPGRGGAASTGQSLAPGTTPATTDAPGRTSRGGHSGGPGTPPTTAAVRRPGTTTSVVTTTTPSAVSPTPPATEPPGPSPTTSTTTPTREPVGPAASEGVALVNAARAAAGVPPLVETDGLHAAAQAHSLDQASMQSMTHIGSDGAGADARIARAGFDASSWGENLAAGYGAADAVIGGWLGGSEQDRANILDPAFTVIGLASAEAGDGTTYWTMLLAG